MALFFWIQILGAVVFCCAYAHRARFDVAGTSVVQLALVAAFMAFNLALAAGAHRAAPGRSARQAVAIYLVWLALSAAVIVAALSNPAWRWSARESAMLWIAAALCAVVLAGAAFRRRPISDPGVHGSLAIACKAVPQVLLAWKIQAEGGSGLPALTILAGHATSFSRAIQVAMMIREGGRDRSRLWLAASEGANWLTWGLVTAAWLAAR